MAENQWKTINPGGKKRVVVTRAGLRQSCQSV